MGGPRRYPDEFRQRAMRMSFEHTSERASQWTAITTISGHLGVNHETLRKWVRKEEADAGRRPGRTTDQLEELKELRRENAEPKPSYERLKGLGMHFHCPPGEGTLRATYGRDCDGNVVELLQIAGPECTFQFHDLAVA